MKIPEQLNEPQFSFYLVQTNGKLPIEKKWNTDGNYSIYDRRLHEHLKQGGNYGVVAGQGNLIVLDFDDENYYESIKRQLPETFTVLSAGRRLPHLYYILDGEMFKKTSVRDNKDKTLCDVQAARCGIIAPGSCIERRYYEVTRDKRIAAISIKQLQNIFGGQSGDLTKKPRDLTQKIVPNSKEEALAHHILRVLNIKTNGNRLYQCPFHSMNGKGNLSVMSSGKLYCFHEQRTWHSVFDFAEQNCYFKKDSALQELINLEKKKKLFLLI